MLLQPLTKARDTTVIELVPHSKHTESRGIHRVHGRVYCDIVSMKTPEFSARNVVGAWAWMICSLVYRSSRNIDTTHISSSAFDGAKALATLLRDA